MHHIGKSNACDVCFLRLGHFIELVSNTAVLVALRAHLAAVTVGVIVFISGLEHASSQCTPWGDTHFLGFAHG